MKLSSLVRRIFPAKEKARIYPKVEERLKVTSEEAAEFMADLDKKYEDLLEMIRKKKMQIKVDKKKFRIFFGIVEKGNPYAIEEVFRKMLARIGGYTASCPECGNTLVQTGAAHGHRWDGLYLVCFSCGTPFIYQFPKLKRVGRKIKKECLRKGTQYMYGDLVE